MISFLFFDFFSDIGFGSVHKKPKLFLFLLSLTQLGLGFQCRGPFFFFLPELFARVRVRVLEILILFLYFFSDSNMDLFFLPRAVAVVTGFQ